MQILHPSNDRGRYGQSWRHRNRQATAADCCEWEGLPRQETPPSDPPVSPILQDERRSGELWRAQIWGSPSVSGMLAWHGNSTSAAAPYFCTCTCMLNTCCFCCRGQIIYPNPSSQYQSHAYACTPAACNYGCSFFNVSHQHGDSEQQQ
jgi:hypothetical protein